MEFEAYAAWYDVVIWKKVIGAILNSQRLMEENDHHLLTV